MECVLASLGGRKGCEFTLIKCALSGSALWDLCGTTSCRPLVQCHQVSGSAEAGLCNWVLPVKPCRKGMGEEKQLKKSWSHRAVG